MRKPKDSLSRGLIRMSWSKRNLFVIYQRGNRPPRPQNRTLFQQKWQARKDTRAYHGAQLSEQQFRRLFEPKLPTSNINLHIKEQKEKHPPVSVLTYASLERRLDFIVFRSCLASSIWAARQMVIHGKVSVNGKKVFKAINSLIKPFQLIKRI